MKNIKSSIVGSADVDPQALDLHELNWRIHGTEQKKALVEAMSKVGWVQRVVVNKRTNKIIDGHMRVAVARARGEATVPVNYVDLSEADERLALATFDPIGSLAFADKASLRSLLESLEDTQDAVKAMLHETAVNAGVEKPTKESDDTEPAAPKKPRPQTNIEVYAIVNDDNSHCCSAARAQLLYATEKRAVLCRTHALALYIPDRLTSEMIQATKALRYVIRCKTVGAAEEKLAEEIIAAGSEPVFMPSTQPDNAADDALYGYDLDAAPYSLARLASQRVILFSKSTERLMNATNGAENIVGVATNELEAEADKGRFIMWQWRKDNGHFLASAGLMGAEGSVAGLGIDVPNPAVIAFAINASTANVAFRAWASDTIAPLGNA
jgi:hypothetical protein